MATAGVHVEGLDNDIRGALIPIVTPLALNASVRQAVADVLGGPPMRCAGTTIDAAADLANDARAGRSGPALEPARAALG